MAGLEVDLPLLRSFVSLVFGLDMTSNLKRVRKVHVFNLVNKIVRACTCLFDHYDFHIVHGAQFTVSKRSS